MKSRSCPKIRWRAYLVIVFGTRRIVAQMLTYRRIVCCDFNKLTRFAHNSTLACKVRSVDCGCVRTVLSTFRIYFITSIVIMKLNRQVLALIVSFNNIVKSMNIITLMTFKFLLPANLWSPATLIWTVTHKITQKHRVAKPSHSHLQRISETLLRCVAIRIFYRSRLSVICQIQLAWVQRYFVAN